jgi:citrate synthase
MRAKGSAMSETAKLIIGDQEYELPIVVGSEGERAVDIRKLRSKTGYVTLDPGFVNTGATTSSITFLNGEQGVLRYRGIPIEQLAEQSTFVETAYLLIYGKLPTADELARMSHMLTYHSMVHEDMRHLFDGFPATGHPMAALSAMVGSLSAYYPDCLEPAVNTETHITRALSKIRTLAAFSYKKTIGQPLMYPRNDLKYCANFLHMMFAVPAEPYEPDPDVVRALDTLLILHADHEQNCSTSTVRLVGSSNANLYASVSAGICALWGPLHGGANQQVMEMLREVHASGVDYRQYMEDVKSGKTGRRLMGFGHRVYKNYDPRATILKKMADKVLAKLNIEDPLLDVARGIEEVALRDDYFVSRKLYPNVDFYSGILYKAIGIPENMFTVMFALGRLPGWIAQWKEMTEDPDRKIGRPRQIYTGRGAQDYVPLPKRRAE